MEDDLELKRLFNEGKKINVLAMLLNRNQGVINSRLKKKWNKLKKKHTSL